MFNLKEFRRKNKITQGELSDRLGVGQSFLSKIENGKDAMPQSLFERLAGIYSIDINDYDAAPTGEDDMLKSSSYPVGDRQSNIVGDGRNQYIVGEDARALSSGKIIPLYDVEAAAGTSYGMDMSSVTHSGGTIEIGGFLRDSESAIKIYGNSMTPNYPSGCIIGAKPHNDSFIVPGNVYVVETSDERYLKRLYYNDDKTAFVCHSDNHMTHEVGPRVGKPFYPEFEIPFSDIRRLFKVVGVIKRNII